MGERSSRGGGAAVLAAVGALGGCNLLVGLDDVSLSGDAGTSSAGAGGSSGSSSSQSGGSTASSGGGGATTSSGGTATGGGGAAGTGGVTSSGGTGGSACAGDGDCTPPLVCDTAAGDCIQPTCDDAKKDGEETAPDCGGPVCPACGDGLPCVAPEDCESGVCAGTCQSPACGDGVVNGTDVCDDGDFAGGDGCSPACTVEPGWVCSGAAPSACVATCGDGLVVGPEQCDDDNFASGDGCGLTCHVEAYHQCRTVAPTTCVAQETRCGDGADGDGDTLVDAMDPDCDLPVYMPQSGCVATWIYRSVDVPLDVPDNQGAGVWSRIVVPDSLGVGHLTVLVDIDHPRDGDVVVTLSPPFGQPRTLTNGNGGNGSGYASTLFDNGCAVSVQAGAAPFAECFKPQSVLPGSGQQAQGVWSLHVQDAAAGQTGTLLGWAIAVCAP